jgi:hypothetical protein
VLSGSLAALRLSPVELASLLQKGLITVAGKDGIVPVGKEVLSLVRLDHPAGWSVLMGIVTVTKTLAALWLKNNFGNRSVSEDTVNAYARDAASGKWLTTHQGIAFSDKDELIDGQHRLLGIVKSGVACDILVSFGWPREIKGRAEKRMDVIDRGRTRSVADQLKIQHGLKNGALIASISNCLANLCYGARTRRLSVGQTLDIYRAFQPAVDWVIERRSKQHGFKCAGVLGAFAFALMPELPVGRDSVEPSKTAVAKMFEALNQNDPLPETSAIKRLRDFLRSDEARLLTASLDRGVAEMTLKAIEIDRAGRACKSASELAATDSGVKNFAARQTERVAKIAAMFRLPEVQP